MPTELPRPGVEIIQEFKATSPAIVRPTLVPFVCGAAKEIVEVTTADGLLNTAARQGSYGQLPRVISQTSFPSPRRNIAEVNVEEATVKVFLQFGGGLKELDRDPGESFLVSQNSATRPGVLTKSFVPAVGLALHGLVMVLAVDVTARLNMTANATVTFSGVTPATPLSAERICTQINAAVGRVVATVFNDGANVRVQIASLKWGAAASVTVRAGGSANTVLGFGANEYRVEGSGFRAQDQVNNTTLSPWIEWSKGSYQVDGVTSAIPGSAVNAEFGFVDSAGTFSLSYVLSGTTFTGASSLDVKVGDEFYADGVLPSSAIIMKVEAARFKIGTVNTVLSVFDSAGKVLSAVYDSANVNTLFSSVPFSPRYAWFMARGLSVNAIATAAALTGTTEGKAAAIGLVTAVGAATYALSAAGLTLLIDVTVDGTAQETQTFTFTGGPFANLAAVVTAINGSALTNVLAGSDGAGTKLTLSTIKTGAGQSITVKSTSTALAALGFTAATNYTGTGSDVEVVDIAASLIATGAPPILADVVGTTLSVEISINSGALYTTYTHTFAGGAPADLAAIVTAVNSTATFAAVITSSASADKLKLTSVASGSAVRMRILNDAANTAIAPLLLPAFGTEDSGEENLSGQTLKFKINDRPRTYSVLFSSDSLVDAVDSINSTVGWPIATIGGASNNQLVLSSSLRGYASKVEVTEDSTSAKANAALGFSGGNLSASGAGRPNPDFSVNISGDIVLGAEVLRSAITGAPVDPGTSDIYVQYTGLRKDVSPLAVAPGLLRISDVATLSTVLSPIRSDNPLALGMFFQLINAPGMEVTGLGVDETSASEPYGTPLAFTRCAGLIESEEIYSIAILTHSETVAQIFKSHVEAMSGPEQKGERILFFCPAAPTRAVDDIISSGLSGNTTATPNQFVLDVDATAGLASRSLTPAALTVANQVLLELVVTTPSGSVVRNYSVSSVNGSLAVLRVAFAAGENTDGFFSVAPLSEVLVNADWKLAVRGNKLLIPGSTLPDKNKIAETVASKASAYKQRRLYYVFPDRVKATLGGTEEVIPGFYTCAAIAGMVAKFAPQQGFTNLPMTGFTGVVGSNDTYSIKQLNVMAGGGAYILMQEAPGTPLTSRHQLSTSLTSIETRELSITKVVDFVAKFLRTGLRNFIGTFNITQPFLDTLSTVIQGMISFLVDNGVIIGGDLNNLIQSKDAPDTVLVDITLDVPFPCNYVRLTLVI